LQVNQTSNTVVQTVDLFPTLCELTKLPVPDFVAGRSLLSELIQPNSDSTETYAISYMPNARSIRSSCYRLIVHCNNHVELYDHDGEGESKNIAAGHPDLVSKLQSQLKHMQRLPDRSWNDD
jgi:iduronate 2-sulfatase